MTMKYEDKIALLGATGSIDVSEMVSVPGGGGIVGASTDRTPDEDIRRQAGRGY